MIARFNIYFNATQKMESALNGLADKHVDAFDGFIDIYPYGSELDLKSMRPSMEEAMKKASKTIQRKPKSKWVDDSYFLIGQTQFFSGDFFSSIETFQFVNSTFKDPEMKAMSQLWLMKSYIQQDKLDDAEAIYGLLEKSEVNEKEFRTHLNLSAGDLLVKQNKKAQAVPLLEAGLKLVKDRRLKYRTNFVLGQLYLELKDYENANMHFIRVLRLNAPYEYVFQANLGMAKVSAEQGGQGASRTKKFLRRMLDDDKNLEYYDQIYYELAKLEFSSEDEEQGLKYMKLSAQNAKNNNIQRTKTYLFLANHYFDNRQYSEAQSYYDSTVAVIPDDYSEAEKVKAKHSVLSKLIESIEEIRMQDSLLQLSSLDREVLDKQIDKKIEQEAEEARLAKEEDEIRKEQERINLSSGRGAPPVPTADLGGVWYFYNATAVSRGANEFKRLWGSRKYADFWRFVNKSSMDGALAVEDAPDDDNDEADPDEIDPDDYTAADDKEQKEALKDVAVDKRKYYENIPFSATAKLVAKRKIQDAFLAIGKIYFDDLREYSETNAYLTKLLDRYPSTRHKPEALFYLSKAATELGEEEDARAYADQVANEFPETVFNSVLNNKEIIAKKGDEEVVAEYEKMYTAYLNDDFDEVFAVKKIIDQNFAGNSLQAKIDYLNALAIGRTQGKEAYIEELEIVKETYKGNEVGERAAYTLRLLTEQENGKESAASQYGALADKAPFFYIITGSTPDGEKIKIDITDYNSRFFSGRPFKVSSLIFGDEQMFYIKQFDNLKHVQQYHEEMIINRSFLTTSGLSAVETYYVSDGNFKLLVKSKDEKEYLKFFRKKYK